MVVADERGAEISDADFLETIRRSVIAPGSGVGRIRVRGRTTRTIDASAIVSPAAAM